MSHGLKLVLKSKHKKTAKGSIRISIPVLRLGRSRGLHPEFQRPSRFQLQVKFSCWSAVSEQGDKKQPATKKPKVLLNSRVWTSGLRTRSSHAYRITPVFSKKKSGIVDTSTSSVTRPVKQKRVGEKDQTSARTVPFTARWWLGNFTYNWRHRQEGHVE